MMFSTSKAKGTPAMPALSIRFLGAAVLAAALPLTVTACGGGGGGGGGEKGNAIVIGTKFDQPGLGLRHPDGSMSGFDVDVAKFVAKELGYTEEQIEWKESPSGQRENLIANDQVSYIVATYSITDARKEKVDFAGPYLITGQSLLVRADTTDITGAESLANNKKLCSVSGSTPAQRIKDKYPGVQLQQYDTYSACVEALKNGAIDAVTTDEVILAGYAAQSPGVFKVVGKPFSEEKYGIGLKKGDTDMRTKINDALAKMEKDGAWKAAFEKNLGPAGIPTPPPPPLDRY
jgi:glutamate transport system substrate-binding protein